MQDLIVVTGIVLKCENIGEFDRRIVLLTKERGKISAFAKGARRVGSKFLASTNPFSFGEFRLYEGRTSYSVNDAIISEYFEGFRDDYEKACYGMLFLELSDYYTVENSDETKMLNLLYVSLKALFHEKFSQSFVKDVFFIKAVCVNGEFQGIPDNKKYDESTVYAVNYIVNTPLNKLYTFTVSDKVKSELDEIASICYEKYIDRPLKSMEFLDNL